MLLEDIAEQATRAWGPPTGERAVVALDFMRVFVPEPGQIISHPGDTEFLPLAFSAASTLSVPPSLPQKPPSGQNALAPTMQPVGANNLTRDHGMLPTAWGTNHDNTPTVNHSFHPGFSPGDVSGPPIPVQATGQSGYYGLGFHLANSIFIRFYADDTVNRHGTRKRNRRYGKGEAGDEIRDADAGFSEDGIWPQHRRQRVSYHPPHYGGGGPSHSRPTGTGRGVSGPTLHGNHWNHGGT